jgi:GT2 family glycosyltransferase
MKISAILPTYARYACLKDLLSDLAGQTRPIEEILVVDQAEPGDRDLDLYRSFDAALPLRVIFLTERRGTCVPRNLAISLAAGDYLLFLDDDLRLEPDYLLQYERVALDGYDVVHGGVRHRDNPLFEKRLFFDDPVQQLIASPNTTQVGGTIGVASGNSLVRREWVERVGGFDIQFDSGMGDDWDFGMQLFRAGARIVYHPGPAVRHLKAPSGGRRGFFIQGWRRMLGSFRQYSPSWLAPRFYFYLKYFSPVAVRRLENMFAFEILTPGYRMIRYPWAVPIALAWWWISKRKARRMAQAGPRTMGACRQPAYEEWRSTAWKQRHAKEERVAVG